MSTSTLNIKQENFHVNFDQLKEKDWIPAVMKLLTLTHGQPGGTQLTSFAKFVANIPFAAQTALLDTHFADADIWDDIGTPTTEYPYKTQTALKSASPEAAQLDGTLFAVLATCVQGSWTTVFDTIGSPLFSRAFATLYRKAQKSIITMKSTAIQALYRLKLSGTCEQFQTDFQQVAADLAASNVDIDDLLLAQVQLAVAAKNNIAGAAITDELLKHAQLTLAKPDTPKINPIDFVQRHLTSLSINMDTKQQVSNMLAEATGNGINSNRYDTCARCNRRHEGKTPGAKPETSCWAFTNTDGTTLPMSTRTAEPPARYSGAGDKDWRSKQGKQPQVVQPPPSTDINLATKLEAMMTQMTKLTGKVAKMRKSQAPTNTVAIATIHEIVSPPAATWLMATTVLDPSIAVSVDFNTTPAVEHFPEILTFMPLIEEIQHILVTTTTMGNDEIQICELQIMQLLQQLAILFSLAMHTGYMPHIDEVMPTILDTGAGIHLVNPTTGHVMGQALPKEVIITDDSQQMQIGGIGGDVMGTAGQATWIQSAIGADGQSYQMSQHDAQACHGAARDVLSVGKLVKAGYEFHLTPYESRMTLPTGTHIPVNFDKMDILTLPLPPTTTTTSMHALTAVSQPPLPLLPPTIHRPLHNNAAQLAAAPAVISQPPLPPLPHTIHRQLHNATQLAAAHAITMHMHIVCSHTRDWPSIHATLIATTGHNYNGHPIRAGFLCTKNIRCHACEVSKIAKRRLARQRQAIALTTPTPTLCTSDSIDSSDSDSDSMPGLCTSNSSDSSDSDSDSDSDTDSMPGLAGTSDSSANDSSDSDTEATHPAIAEKQPELIFHGQPKKRVNFGTPHKSQFSKYGHTDGGAPGGDDDAYDGGGGVAPAVPTDRTRAHTGGSTAAAGDVSNAYPGSYTAASVGFPLSAADAAGVSNAYRGNYTSAADGDPPSPAAAAAADAGVSTSCPGGYLTTDASTPLTMVAAAAGRAQQHVHFNEDADDESSDDDAPDIAHDDVDRLLPSQQLLDEPRYQANPAGVEMFYTRLTDLEPGSQIYLDSKPYPHEVTGGWKYTLQVVDKFTKREATIDHRTKTSVGQAFQQIIIAWDLHHLPYEVCVYLDGCGSNKHIVDMCMQYGLNWCYLPPDEQSLNLAEPYIKRTFDAARATLAQVSGILPAKYLRQAVHVVTVQNNHRVPPGGTITPLEAWYGNKPDVAFLTEFAAFQVVRKTRDQDKRQVEHNSKLLELDIHGNLIATHNGNNSLRGDDAIFIGYPTEHRLKTHMFLKISNTKDRESIVTARSHTLPQYSHHHQPYAECAAQGSTDSSDDSDTIDTDDAINIRTSTPVRGSFATDSDSDFGSNYSDDHTDTDDSVFPGPNSTHDTGTIRGELTNAATRHTFPDPDESVDPLLSTSFHIDCQNVQIQEAVQNVFNHSITSKHPSTPITPPSLPSTNIYTIAADSQPGNTEFLHIMAAKIAKRVMTVANDKDIPWNAIIGTELEEPALQAFDAEFDNMTAHGFEVIKPGDLQHAEVLPKARPGRVILAKKRADSNGDQRVKARGVELGHLSKSDPATNTYSPVASQEVLRAVVLQPGRNNPHPKGPRLIATIDVSQAYLQGDDNPAGYVKFLHPLTKKHYVVKLRCPIYGSDKAAKWWFESLRRKLLKMGFVQGFNHAGSEHAIPPEYLRAPAANCPCLFFHPERDLIIIVYVDDVLADGRQEDLDWFFAGFQERFKTTPVNWLTPSTPIDFTGIIISMDDTMIYMSMQPYIKKALALFDMTGCAPNRLPMRQDITDDTPLQSEGKAEFMKKMGVCHWVATSVALTTKPATSRIGQHMANPTAGALQAIDDLLRYHATNSNQGLGTPLIDLDLPTGADAFEISTDADNSSDPSINNKRRARYGDLIGYKNSPSAIASTGGRASSVSPVICNSKTLGISFAVSQINEAHVGLGSGENEIYAMANTIDDAIYFSFIFEEMGRQFMFPMQVKTDATTAKVFAMGTAMRSRLRHVDQRQWWVQTCRDKRLAEVSHEAGDILKADVMTKNFYNKPGLFERKRAEIQVKVPPTSFSQ